jgi:Domain of unknown function (DUF4424)
MRKIWVVAAALMAASPALADDSTAELSAGGLVLTKNTDIRMASESLRISPYDVKVRYEFVNDSGHDIDAIVAFPLPDVDLEKLVETPIGRMSKDTKNFVDFKATADGKPIAAQFERKAMQNGKDVSDKVRAAGLDIDIYSEAYHKQLDNLPVAKKKQLQTQGLMNIEEDWVQPRWTVQTKYYWTQHFPAHKTVVIEHAYKPVTGQSFFDKYGLEGDSWKYYRDTFCIDKATEAGLRHDVAVRPPQKGNAYYMFWASDTGFILKTANNWKGPIGRFHLTLDKLKPGNILSLCWNAPLKKTGPTTYESSLANFAPTQDLRILVLE